jgi:chemotaxis protein histidine kinase CheA
LPAPTAELSLDDLDNAVSALTSAGAGSGSVSNTKDVSRGFVVVVRDGTSAMGLVVDELLGQEEVVVKPVSDVFAYHKAISGATISGDGQVHMILDVPFLLKELSGHIR